MAEQILHIKTQSSVSYENNEEYSIFEPLKNTLSELNIVIAQFLDINQEDEYEDRDGFFLFIF